MLEGRPLIAHVAASLAVQCDAVVVCGPAWGELPALTDRPAAGLGPMAGLCAALHQALAIGADQVLAAPCDLLGIPADLAASIGPGPAVVDGQWLLGLWPAQFAQPLEALLDTEGAISARRWIVASGATVRPISGLRNINRISDLD